MRDLTKRQEDILLAITNFIKDKGYAPTVREVGEMVHLASTSTTQGHLEKLKNKGYVTWEPSQPRTIRVLKGVS